MQVITKAMPFMALIPLVFAYLMIAYVLITSQENVIKKFGGRKSLAGLLAMYTSTILLVAAIIGDEVWKIVFIAGMIIFTGGNAVEHVVGIFKKNNDKQ